MSNRRRSDGRGRWWVLGIFALGVLARCAGLERLGLEHFDEAVYALSGLWSQGLGLYVGQHFYSPPLLPGLIGVSYWLIGGPSDQAAIAVNLLAGSLTVLIVSWVGRRWYGPAAGLAAGSLAALSGIHILYSRMAMTDVLLTALLVLAVGCLRESLLRGSVGWAVAAGAVTAAGWNAKYNGWLPLAIGAVAVGIVSARRVAQGQGMPWRLAWCWATTGGIAALGYLPWLLYVEGQPGGYEALVAHHRGFLVGWGGWSSSLVRQAANLQALDALIDRCALAAALVVGALYERGIPKSSRARPALVVLGVAAGALQLGGLVAGLTLLVLAIVLRRPLGAIGRTEGGRDATAVLHATWFVGLLLLTPFYTPYVRLALPWLAAVWLAVGAAVARWLVPIVSWDEGQDAPRGGWVRLAMIGVSLLAIGTFAMRLPRVALVELWRPTDSYRIAAREMLRTIPPGAEVLVYAEPPAVFYLSLSGGEAMPVAVKALDSLQGLEQLGSTAGRDRLLVLGPHRNQEPREAAWLAENGSQRLRLIASIPLEVTNVEGAAPLPLELFEVVGEGR